VLKYPSRISSLEVSAPTFTDSSSSRALRVSVCSCERKVFFTYCWVMVEPDCTSPPRAMFTTARPMPIGSMPASSQNVAFSAETTASWQAQGMSVSSTFCRFRPSSPPEVTIWVPSAQ
jgi:hypothetical protein